MDVLTRERAKPVLPYGGTHRLIDFALSSLANSGLVDVWVSVEYQVASIDDYLSGGRPWSLDRNRGGFRRMVPQTGQRPGDRGRVRARQRRPAAADEPATSMHFGAPTARGGQCRPRLRGRPDAGHRAARGVRRRRHRADLGGDQARGERRTSSCSPAAVAGRTGSRSSRRGPAPARSPPRSSSTSTEAAARGAVRAAARAERRRRTPTATAAPTAGSATSASTCCRG